MINIANSYLLVTFFSLPFVVKIELHMKFAINEQQWIRQQQFIEAHSCNLKTQSVTQIYT